MFHNFGSNPLQAEPARSGAISSIPCEGSSPFTGHHVVERSLVEQGVHRRAILKIANYTSVPDVVAQTDLLVLIPSRVARAFEKTYGLRWLPLPVSVPSFDVRIHWSVRHQGNEGHLWMRKVLTEVLREL
jgi:DNA-binding transcriptional LysR family regulator